MMWRWKPKFNGIWFWCCLKLIEKFIIMELIKSFNKLKKNDSLRMCEDRLHCLEIKSNQIKSTECVANMWQSAYSAFITWKENVYQINWMKGVVAVAAVALVLLNGKVQESTKINGIFLNTTMCILFAISFTSKIEWKSCVSHLQSICSVVSLILFWCDVQSAYVYKHRTIQTLSPHQLIWKAIISTASAVSLQRSNDMNERILKFMKSCIE